MELSSPKLKKLLVFQEGIFQSQKIQKIHSKKNFLIFSQKKFFLYFKKRNFLPQA